MKKFWAILGHEYARHVLRKRFVLVLFSMPAYILLMISLGLFSVWITMDFRPVGFVDQSGVIVDTLLPEKLSLGPLGVKFLPFESEQAGRAAFDEKTIQALFLLPADFRQTRGARLVVNDRIEQRVRAQFETLLQYNMLRNHDAGLRSAVMENPEFEEQSINSGSAADSANPLNIGVAFGAGFLLMAAIFSTSGYLIQAVVEEKENRTMEILATSAPAGTIINAKLIAFILIGFTQLAFWLAPLLGLLALAQSIAPIPLPPFNLSLTLLAMLTILPTFVMIAAMMAMVAVTLTEVREGQQVMSIFSMVAMVPFMVMTVIIASPDGSFAVLMSFIPLTASLTLIMRAALDSVPTWQIALSGLIVTATAALCMLLLGRIFRAAMLNTGKRLALGSILLLILPRPLAARVERVVARLRPRRRAAQTRHLRWWQRWFTRRAAARQDETVQAASPEPFPPKQVGDE